MTQEEIKKMIEEHVGQQFVFPAGTIMAFAGKAEYIPEGWKLCNGDKLDRKKYKILFDAIGTNWGNTADPYFNIPNLCGYFLRGVDNGAKNDPDVATRYEYKKKSSIIGDRIGSYQEDEFHSHNHKYFSNTKQEGGIFVVGGGHANCGFTEQTSVEGNKETRPINAAVNWIIKT